MSHNTIQYVSTKAILNGMFRRDDAWNIISDFSQYPRIMENVDKVVIHEKNKKEGISEWVICLDKRSFTTLTWTEHDYYDKDNYELRFESINGDFDQIGGFWRIKNDKSGEITLYFDLRYYFGLPVLEEHFTPILHEKMEKMATAMMNTVVCQMRKNEQELRSFKRLALDVRSDIILNNSTINASVMDISQGGVMFHYDGKLDLHNISFSLGNVAVTNAILHKDLKRGNYRVVFKKPLNGHQVQKLVDTIDKPLQRVKGVQEALMLDNSKKDTKDSSETIKDKDEINLEYNTIQLHY